MPTVSPKQLQTCRRLALLSVGLYAVSFLIVAAEIGGVGQPLVWLPILFLWVAHPAFWANLTLAWGWYQLRKGRVAKAKLMGVVSVVMAVLYWCNPVPFIDSVMPVLAVGYCGWVGSMVMLIVAPRLTAPDPERDEPPK